MAETIRTVDAQTLLDAAAGLFDEPAEVLSYDAGPANEYARGVVELVARTLGQGFDEDTKPAAAAAIAARMEELRAEGRTRQALGRLLAVNGRG